MAFTSPYSHMQQYVFSRSMAVSPDDKVELVSDNAIEFVSSLKQTTGKGIWLCGGANLASALFAAQLMDQLILKVNPFLMGSSIPLFADVMPQTALALTNRKIYDNGVVQLHYEVN
ncbi:dihydrofolate reductase family protein [Romeriopsis navalis]|uniref:dihydrofolate reductase family protein n=1 Tax=Romeriopsis navalis TaxID=2992132 RepID=UPI0021F8B6BB|nr:dihydrofolate reductase family protein [Romeriopsis navalis]